MHKRRISTLKLLLLTLAVIAALGVSGLALAQSSTLFDLACWGIFTNGGEVRVSTSAEIRDTFGQPAVGTMSSPTVIIRSGYAQNWSAPTVAQAQVEPAGEPISRTNVVHMPLLWSFIKQARSCA
jgi:hypothetical protein